MQMATTPAPAQHEPPLTQREVWVAEDMLRDTPMIVAVALDGDAAGWPVAHIDTARCAVRAEYQRRVDAEQAKHDAAVAQARTPGLERDGVVLVDSQGALTFEGARYLLGA